MPLGNIRGQAAFVSYRRATANYQQNGEIDALPGKRASNFDRKVWNIPRGVGFYLLLVHTSHFAEVDSRCGRRDLGLTGVSDALTG